MRKQNFCSALSRCDERGGFCLLLISRVKFATSNPGLLVLHKWQLEENEQNLHPFNKCSTFNRSTKN
ncbi:hypothetical protein T11_2375 [Trichinella zimbabwensis]|uniref:Uncharacterized protein n=1 Tax=Trichinella zimbabwensis TaxID=268475 RepID=A0A0V1H2R1_9BILA|nr:hypothetical protein T11_2375 [Trichinella zimbabwensis]